MTEALFKSIQGENVGERKMFFRRINDGKRIETVWAEVIEDREGNIAEEFSPRASILTQEKLKSNDLLTIEEAAKEYGMDGNLKR